MKSSMMMLIILALCILGCSEQVPSPTQQASAQNTTTGSNDASETVPQNAMSTLTSSKDGIVVTVTRISYEPPAPNNVFIKNTSQDIQNEAMRLYNEYRYAIGTSREQFATQVLMDKYGQYLNKQVSISFTVKSDTPFWFFDYGATLLNPETNKFHNAKVVGSSIEEEKSTLSFYSYTFTAPHAEKFYLVVRKSDTELPLQPSVEDMRQKDGFYLVELRQGESLDG